MEQPNDFKYFMTVNNVRKELVFAPSGWDEKSDVKYTRSNDYYGMLRLMGIPFEYIKDGAFIIRNAMYSRGLEAVVTVEVQQLNRITFQYEITFIGEVDLSEFQDEKDNITVAMIEGGISKSIKAYESVDYEIKLIGSDVVKMIIPGVAIAESGEGIFTPYTSGDRDDYIPGSIATLKDMGSGFAATRDADQSGNFPDFATSDSYFLSATRVLNMKISVHVVGFTGDPQGRTRISSLDIRDQTGAVIKSFQLANVPNTTFDKSFQDEFVTQIGSRYFFYLSTDDTSMIQINEGEYTVSYASVSDPSECLGLKSFDLYNRIIQKVNPGTTAVSYLLSNKWKNLIFTSGDGIRQIDKAKINISLKDFFKTINAIEDANLGTEANKAILELSSYFYRNIESANVGEVATCKIKPAKDYIFNSFKVGYDDGNTDETNGKQEYNSSQVWYNTITRIQKPKDWISPTRADQYGIEDIRVQVVKEPTSDNSEDNSPFMIDCYFDGKFYRPILGSSYQQVTGLTNPDTAYNLALTPKKNLLRHSGYLRSMLYKMDDNYINFGSGQKNTELKTVIGGVGVKENENIIVGSLSNPYFMPFVAEIKCELPRGIKNLFDSNPYGYITFKYNNVTLKGYILNASIDIAKNKQQDFELLLTNDNDLLKFLENA